MTRGLREASYAVDAVADGRQALALLAGNEYDVVLLDILLPGASGLDICRTIRESGSQVPILMLTALDAVADRCRMAFRRESVESSVCRFGAGGVAR